MYLYLVLFNILSLRYNYTINDYTWYNICGTWLLDTRISTYLSSKVNAECTVHTYGCED